MVLSEHDFLTPDECARTTEIVHGLKDYWVNRGSGFLPVFTLGTATYLDANKGSSYLDPSQMDPTRYLQEADRLNPILKSNFPLLYEKLTETLSSILKMKVSFANGFGMPGFHIFLAAKMFENPIAPVHFDMNYLPLKWDYEEVDFEHPISFTCPIKLPSSPAGLNYWDIGAEYKDLPRNELEKLKETKEQHFFPYHLGKLVLHRGLILHQIAPTKDMKPDDERLTLQGHGLVCDGIMRLYW